MSIELSLLSVKLGLSQ